MYPPVLFVAVQFPFADLRGFIDRDTGRLPVPSWPDAEPESFVRSSGGVRERRELKIPEWRGETSYCLSRNALKFQDGLGSWSLLKSVGLRPICSFRRLYSSGCVTRLEVAFRFFRHGGGEFPRLSAEQARALIEECAHLPVRIHDGQGYRHCTLLEASSHLARHYLMATTRRNRREPPPETWWLSAGRPLFLLEHCPGDLVEAPPDCERIDLPDADFRLAHTALRGKRGPSVGVWLLSSSPESKEDSLRRLRVHLFRLHAEDQALRLVIRELRGANARLQPPASSRTFHELRTYLQGALEGLNRPRRYGFEQLSLLQIAEASVEAVDPNLRAGLLAEASEHRSYLEWLLTQYQIELGRPVTHWNIGTARDSIIGSTVTNIASVSTGSRSPGRPEEVFAMNASTNPASATSYQQIQRTGDVYIERADHSTVLSPHMTVNSPPTSPSDLSALLDKLNDQIDQLSTSQKLTSDEIDQAKRDLATLTAEVTAPKPREKAATVTGEGLIEAAKKVKEFAIPIAETVNLIFKTLKFAAVFV